MQDITVKISDPQLLEKTQNKCNKIELLIKKLEKQYRIHLQTSDKPTFEENNGFNTDFFKTFHNMTYLLQITLLEISHSLENLGLFFFQSPLLQLFQFFKYSSVMFMKGNLKFFHQWVRVKEAETLAEENLRKTKLFEEVLREFIDYVKEIKGLKKIQAKSVSGNKFEQMEKIRFLLEQEGYELEQLLLDTLHSRDEIDTFLKNKINTKTVHASGAFKILETMAFSKEADPVNYDSLLKLVDKRIENEMPRTAKKKDLIHEITRNIFSKVQKAQQKKIKDGKVFTAEYYQKKLQKIDLDMITLEKEVQTEDEEDIFRRKSMAVRKMMKNNEINNYTKDLEAYNEEILRKCHAFELQKNTLENEKNEALMQIKQAELKLKLKKEKNSSLKKLIQELRDKLMELSERESHALNLFRNKEKECALLLIKQEELQQMFTVQLKDMTEKRDFLDKKVKENHYSRINSRLDENYSPSNSPLHRYESKPVIDSDSQKSNQIIKEKDKSKKKQSLKRKRASTMDVKILNRLTQKPNSPLDGRKPLKEQKEQIKTTPRKISEKPESHERMSIMTRSRSVFVATTKPKTSIKGLQKPEISTHLDPQPRVSLPQNFNVSDSKSFIESNSTEKKLETLEEMSKDGQNSPIMEAANASFERDSIMFQEKKGKKLLLDENIGVEFKDFPKVGRDQRNIQTKEIACQIKPEKREQESMAYFVDKAELYVQKLQKMVDQNNQNMRYILERIFLNRNHQTFIEDLVNFLKNCSFKKIDRFTQTEDFLISIRPLSMKKSASKPSDRKIMSMSQTAKNEGISTRREDFSEFYEMHPETYDINPKSQKSQSQHVTRTNFNLNVSVKQKNDTNEVKKETYYQTYLNEKTNRTEKPQIPSNFLFNKAIKGDLFGELNKINRVQSQEISKRNKNAYEKMSRNIPLYDEFLMKIDIDREREENQEREKLIKRLSQHIAEMKEKKEENFAKIKHFFKYPFKTVRELVDNEPEVGIDDGRIEELVSKFVNRHRVCGVNCEHLRRFYKRIGFINLQINRKEAMMNFTFTNLKNSPDMNVSNLNISNLQPEPNSSSRIILKNKLNTPDIQEILLSPPKQTPKKVIILEPNDNKIHEKLPLSHHSISYPLVKKFIEKLKAKIFFSRITSLNNEGRQIINDVTDDIKTQPMNFPLWVKKNHWENLFKFGLNALSKLESLPVLTPYDNLRFIFDLVHFFILLFLIFWVPIELCFETYLPQVLNELFLIAFVLDIVASMNTGYFFNGYIVKKRRLIYAQYLRKAFLWDLISIIGFGMDHPMGKTKYSNLSITAYVILKAIFFVRFRNFLALYSKFVERLTSKFIIKDSLVAFVNLIFYSVFILHVFACFWYFIAKIKFDEPNSPTWVGKLSLLEESIEVKYMYSLYWASVTIMTVGYGDISPQNGVEVWFTIFAIFFGCGVVAYIISAIGNIMLDLGKDDLVFKQNVYIMNQFMSRKKISSNLQLKIRQYLRFIWQEELTQNVEFENAIVEKLSKSLKEELYLEANGSILNRYSMFFANFSEKMLRLLMYQMKEVRFNPEDLIFAQNSTEDSEIYFITKGKVEISIDLPRRYSKNFKKSLQILTKDSVFGELSFFSGLPRSASAKSKDFSTMLCIKRDDFLKILNKFPEDYEKYCLIRDQLTIDSNFNSINTSCYSCNSFEHLMKDCPLFHFSRIFQINKIKAHSQQLSRIVCKRKRKKSNNARKYIDVIQKKTENFQDYDKMNNSDFINNLNEVLNEEEMTKSMNPPIITISCQRFPDDDNKKTSTFNRIINNKNYHLNIGNESDSKDEFRYFDAIGQFKNYYPDFNIKNIIANQKNFQKKKEEPKNEQRRNKLQTYFSSKNNNTMLNSNSIMQQSTSGKKMSCIYTENQINTEFFGQKPKQQQNLFDLVYEVLTNEDLRKKLMSLKKARPKKKGSRT